MPGRHAIRSMCHFLVGSAWLVLSTACLAQGPAEQHADVELVSEKDAIVPHHELQLGICFHLEEGWHTYWVNPGDSGEAPRVEWTLPAGFQANSIQWPYPTRLSTPPFVDYGYEHQVLLQAVIQTPPGLKEGATERIVANVHYLICREVCIPGRKQLALELPVKDQASSSSNAAWFESGRRQLPRPVPASWRISAASAGDEFQLRLRIGKVTASPQFFPLEPEQIENAAPQSVSPIPGGLDLHLKKSNHLLKPISRIKGVIVVGGAAYLVDVPVLQSSSRGPEQSKPN